MNKRKIEIFTAGCPLCNPVVDMVKELASESLQEVTIYDLVKQYENKECKTKVDLYNVKRLPSVVVGGKLLACCTNEDITRQHLITAGIGKNVIL